jgi:hypothetical protein
MIKIGVCIVLGIILAVNLTGYFTMSSSLLYNADYRELVQIKHLLWIAIVVYIGGQMK